MKEGAALNPERLDLSNFSALKTKVSTAKWGKRLTTTENGCRCLQMWKDKAGLPVGLAEMGKKSGFAPGRATPHHFTEKSLKQGPLAHRPPPAPTRYCNRLQLLQRTAVQRLSLSPKITEQMWFLKAEMLDGGCNKGIRHHAGDPRHFSQL